MGFAIIDDVEKLKKYRDKWMGVHTQELFTPFLSYEWISEWLKYFGKGRKPLVLVEEKNDRIVSLMPVIASGLRYRFVGYNNSDYLDALNPSKRFDLMMDLMSGFVSHYGVFDLEHIPEDSDFLKYARENFKNNVVVVPQEVCPYMELANDWDQCKASLNKRFRKNLEYSTRRLQRDFEFEVQRPHSVEDVEVFMRYLIRYHQERWHRKGMPGAFYSERVRRFHISVAKRLFEVGFLLLNAISINGEIAAVIYGFKTDRCYYYYLSGFDRRYSKFSIGNVLIGLTVKEAVENGARVFDFLRGNESYKYLWTNKSKRIYRVVISCGTALSEFLKRGVLLEDRIVRYVKEKFS